MHSRVAARRRSRSQELFTKEGSRIAAVIIEPTPANHGLLPQRKEYLEKLRAVTKQHGALLIFDEVISGFRVARGGVSQLTGIQPDLATFGKIIGGGMPVGAFGGSRKIMSRLAPEGDTYQAGTLSGNPVAMSAGVAALDALIRNDAWAKLEALGASLERMVAPVIAKAPFPIQFVRSGSLFWLALHEGPAPRAPSRSARRMPIASLRSSTRRARAASICRLRLTRCASCRWLAPRRISSTSCSRWTRCSSSPRSAWAEGRRQYSDEPTAMSQSP